MNKYNRRFITRYRRFERWYNITCGLAEFDGLTKSYDSASPDEVRTLKVIRGKLRECYVLAKSVLEEVRINGR